jgi:predicted DNA-binding antitoxin AbrB/MazE fold protein
MKTIHAIFEGGVFRPLDEVQLPERCEVEFEPRIRQGAPSCDAMGEVYKVLAERHASGDSDVAARHDEHQP